MNTSTYLEVKGRLKTLLTTAFADQRDVNVTWSWTPERTNKAVFLSRPFFIDDADDRDSSSIDIEPGAITTGRLRRDEEYTLPVSVAVFHPEVSSSAAQTADEATWALAAVIDDLIAEDPKLGLTSIQWARLSGIDREQYPRMNDAGAPIGWVVVLVLLVTVRARLT